MNVTQSCSHLYRLGRLALVAALALGISNAATAAPVGFMANFRGMVDIQPDQETQWKPAAIDGAVSVGDSIRTGRASFAKVVLVDDTLLEIGGDSEILIDRMIVGDLATQERSILRELNGHLRAYVGERFGGTTRLEVHTPTAVVGVKGSAMEIWVLDQNGRLSTVVSNVEGEVWVKRTGAPDGSETILAEGQSSIVAEGEGPTAPSEGLPFGLTPLPSSPQTIVSNEVTDVILTGGTGVAAGGPGGAAVGDLVADTAAETLLSQTLNTTDAIGRSVGPQEVFESGGADTGLEGEEELFLELPNGPTTAAEAESLFNPMSQQTPSNNLGANAGDSIVTTKGPTVPSP